MSPEYAMEGNFSEKSDVYSFGVLLLEIVSGRKNSTIYYDLDRPMNLVGFVSHLNISNTFIAIYIFTVSAFFIHGVVVTDLAAMERRKNSGANGYGPNNGRFLR